MRLIPKGDLISREALKEELKSYFSDGLLDNISAKLAFNMILRKIDDTPTIPKDKWIPVSERLPEKEGFYLVFLGNEQMAVAHSSGIIANHDFEPKMLAWQPLPKPYKEGGKE